MKKFLLSLCVICALTACKDEQKVTQHANEKPVIKIGAILPLSGDMAVWGNAEKNGLLLAQEKLSENTKHKYELVIEDSANANKNIQHIAQKLIMIDKVDALITMFDPAANIVGPIASANKILHFGQSWFPKYVGDKYNYNVYTDMTEEAELIAEYLDAKNIQKAYLFTVNQTGFIGGTNILKEMLSERGINYQETFFNFGQRDFKTDIIKAKEYNSEAYIIGAFAPEADILASQLKQIIGEDVIITGLDLGLNIANKKLYEGSVFASPSMPENNFINEYKTKFEDENYMFGGVVGYVTFNTIAYAFENTKKENTADFILQCAEVPTIFDKNITKNKGMIYIPSALLTIRNNQILRIEE